MTTDIQRMLTLQLELQEKSFIGCAPNELEPDARAAYIRDNVLACTDELHEALAEVGWKPWATNREIEWLAFVKEMVDAWHFFMNLLLAASPPGTTTDEIALLITSLYEVKNAVNAERQEAGYDGVSSKCPGCHREMTDSGVIDAGAEDGHQRYACGACGKVLPVNHPMALIQGEVPVDG